MSPIQARVTETPVNLHTFHSRGAGNPKHRHVYAGARGQCRKSRRWENRGQHPRVQRGGELCEGVGVFGHRAVTPVKSHVAAASASTSYGWLRDCGHALILRVVQIAGEVLLFGNRANSAIP